MEGTVGDSISGTNSWAVASLVLGIMSMAGGCIAFGIPPILAIVFGIIAMQKGGGAGGQGRRGQGMALAGVILGAVALVLAGLLLLKPW